MPDSSWIAYVGAVTGTIGSITGIGALWVAIQANQKSSSTKAMDLRIDLGKAIHEAENGLAVLRVLIKEADISRKTVARVNGGFDSKSTDDWNRNIQTFENFAKTAREAFFKQLNEIGKKSVSELEKDIIETAMSKSNLESIEKLFVNAKKRYDSEFEGLKPV